MPNVNPRTNLTLKPELHDLIQETADHLGLKRAQLITNLLEEFAPQFEKMCIAFREIKEKQVLRIDFRDARRQLKPYPNDDVLGIREKMLNFILNINGFTCTGTTGIDNDVMFQNVFSFIYRVYL